METDLFDTFGDVIEAVLGVLQGAIWLLIVLGGLLFNRRKRKQAPSRSAPAPGRSSTGTYRERAPIDPANQPGFGTTYTSAEPTSSPYATRPAPTGSTMQAEIDRSMPTNDDPLSFGSVFDERDDRRGSGQTKWGFDETEWGSSFGPKKSSEPTITQG